MYNTIHSLSHLKQIIIIQNTKSNFEGYNGAEVFLDFSGDELHTFDISINPKILAELCMIICVFKTN